MTATETGVAADWRSTACILCECNCGIEVRLGGEDGRRFERIRGDKAHPASQGYTCEKALRLDHYQNGLAASRGPSDPNRIGRILSPLRRRSDGTFEEIDWNTAITEIAARLKAVQEAAGPEVGGQSVFYYGGGGQGNHLGGGYGNALLRAVGGRFRSSALAQEKTGEFWVNHRMLGAMVRADFDHAEVAVFVGKNPWQSHSIPHARTTLKEIARDPGRSLIVIDPRRTETAELADFHLRVRPGTDAWLLAALAGVIVQEDLVAHRWLAEHAADVEETLEALVAVPVAEYCARSGVPEDQVRAAARRIAGASGGVAVFEDLGVQMNRHSTLVSWLEKLLWVLTGNFGKPGAVYSPSSLVDITAGGKIRGKTPVVGMPLISGLVPCNVIAEEILTDHPARYRAMIVESANPAHSLADSPSFREALRALDLVVVIDVAMTETARLAHYVLPAATQYEKWEATFFNFEFPRNVFHLRAPLLEPPDGPLPEPEIHARLVEALGAVTEEDLAPLREAAAACSGSHRTGRGDTPQPPGGRAAFAMAFFAAVGANPKLGALAPVVLYRTLGPTLPDGAAAAAVLWAAAHKCAQTNPEGVRRAGFTGEGLEAGEQLFEAILSGRSGVVITDEEYDGSWRRVRTPDGRVHVTIPELLAELENLATEPPASDPDWPFVLSAGERRSFTANTIMRDPTWRKRDPSGALRVSPGDAGRLGLIDGGLAHLTTRRGGGVVTVEVDARMQDGHLSLPNGFGLSSPSGNGEMIVTGLAPNELTDAAARDPYAGTPWHKYVPARLTPLDP
ncbi:MAG TPA: molybdopterin-dependent oxidoreductase [Acidimicrobiia bacterium]|nr:molybdopterin-dependent oxidoreductase [Acidimicrobiia bacterium]